MWYDNCFLKYSNKDLLGNIDNMNKFYMWNVCVGQKRNSPPISKFKNQNREHLGLHEISSQIPQNSDERIGVHNLDQTHCPCAQRGAHPRESRTKELLGNSAENAYKTSKLYATGEMDRRLKKIRNCMDWFNVQQIFQMRIVRSVLMVLLMNFQVVVMGKKVESY
ncbi:hypothetical protein H5410_064600 [Solanum commersonii]|uniref:Uncharacterized protein n=1 Tax=Solanum commersonii TaxID=4109 RepID=A0A9J5VYX7_SOLCO|nr:hypothetical protein H5410_064600 [Solanum commersonii]